MRYDESRPVGLRGPPVGITPRTSGAAHDDARSARRTARPSEHGVAATRRRKPAAPPSGTAPSEQSKRIGMRRYSADAMR
ncbi:hypothetical protein MYA_3060 [Burkholderia sp. KJ006]|nr:hypothetical protein MYA_3060 [Burkholderia sp. KJ006]